MGGDRSVATLGVRVLGGHLKSGQSWTAENRPVGSGREMVYLVFSSGRKSDSSSHCPRELSAKICAVLRELEDFPKAAEKAVIVPYLATIHALNTRPICR